MNFTNVIKDIEMGEIILDYPDGPNVNLNLYRREATESKEKRSERKEAEVGEMQFLAGKGQEPRNVTASRRWKNKEMNSPPEPRKDHTLANTD